MTLWLPAADVQAWIGADKITLDDATALAQVASDCVQQLIERDLSLRTAITESYDTNGTDYILLNAWPIISVAAVSYNGVAVAPAAFQQPGWAVDPFNPRKLVFRGMGKLARGLMMVGVTYTAGYDTTAAQGTANALPGDAYHALRLTAAAIFNSQAADPNLASESTGGVFSGSFYPSGVGAVPPGARTLLLRQMRASP